MAAKRLRLKPRWFWDHLLDLADIDDEDDFDPFEDGSPHHCRRAKKLAAELALAIG